jgi:xanthine dehydrogenase YagS FAD-binding subunit
VVLGAVAPVPWRSEAAEKVLEGNTSISSELAVKAADAALEGAEPMSQNAWRLKLVRAAVRRALLLADGKEID